ncbi:glycosyl transferases group 1-domain-containing protein [Auriculariales sp. MPI-PUGE-AT-0066]|nr:glycosyl transferases group 1-domain-containing protein [Auriculariales sp. MPI-PUGE-AT-0066]
MASDETSHDTPIQLWPLLSVAFILCASPLLVLAFELWRKSRQSPKVRSVAVVVLGDIGRSPRMMYHADSFAQADFDTWIIGYRGSRPIPSLRSMRYLYVSIPSRLLNKAPRILFPLIAPWKVAVQTISLANCLLFRMRHAPEFIIVQNPPSIPTLAVVKFAAFIRHSKVIIDWHNTGYSILALRLGERHALVKLSKRFEGYFGQHAYAHLFVTDAMRKALIAQWDLRGHAVVLHDRPPSHFHPGDPLETHELFVRLFHEDPEDLAIHDFLPEFDAPKSTPFTEVTTSPHGTFAHVDLTVSPFSDTDVTVLRQDRPALLVSSTSWTPDERFDILLSALELYEAAAARAAGSPTPLPKVLVLVTGRGPMRAQYMETMGHLEKTWKWVRCRSLWLEAEDYPRLLGAADLGISMHASSSGLDLPMKIVDMFGCGLPVCALNFACLHELVQDSKNGRVFEDAPHLASQLELILTGYPRASVLEQLRKSLVAQRADPSSWGSWQDNWSHVIRPLILPGAVEAGAEKWLEGFAQRHAGEDSVRSGNRPLPSALQ